MFIKINVVVVLLPFNHYQNNLVFKKNIVSSLS